MRRSAILSAGFALATTSASAVSPSLPHCLSPSGEVYNRIEELRDGLDVFVVAPGTDDQRVEISQCASLRKIVVRPRDDAWRTNHAINRMYRLVSDARELGMDEMTRDLDAGLSAAQLVAIEPGACPCQEGN